MLEEALPRTQKRNLKEQLGITALAGSIFTFHI